MDFLIYFDTRFFICRDIDEDDIYVTLDEAAAYVMQELHMERDRAKQFVLTVDLNGDGLVSSVELVTLRDRIKDMQVSFKKYFVQCMWLLGLAVMDFEPKDSESEYKIVARFFLRFRRRIFN